MRIADAFSAARWRVCWVTTYTFDPAFFEAFLLRRLGDPPFNTVVLADANTLAETWAAMGPHDTWRVGGLNRSYLVRPVRVPGGAFHAKTILLGNDKKGLLLVGSGNVGLSGLESGHEIYSRFEFSDQPSAFATWREWMADVVGRMDDRLVRSRWADMLARLPWLSGQSAANSPFVHTGGRPLLDAFMDGLVGEVDQLHVTAPFFDHQLEALRTLTAATRARELFVYLGRGASVAGPRLATFLDAAPGRTALAYQAAATGEPTYVHAKIIAALSVGGARVIAGSANMSGPALLSRAWSSNGNVEAVAISTMERSAALELLVPADRLSAVPMARDEIERCTLAEMPEGSAYDVQLVSATRRRDGTVALDARPPAGAGAFLTDGHNQAAIAGGIAQFEAIDDSVQFVWITDETARRISNSVPVDDEVALDHVLVAGQAGTDNRPRELDPLDIGHPLGRILFDLNQNAVFDVDDTAASRRLALAKASTGEEGGGDADAFWELYFREELGRDPRAGRYHRLGTDRDRVGLFLDEFGALLLQMLERAPRPNELRLIDGAVISRDDPADTGVRWSDARRIRTRAFHVLQRWAAAVNDPRVRWFGELAPIRHYEALLGALAQIWPTASAERDEDRWLTEEQLSRVLRELLAAFVRNDRLTGYLAGLDDRSTAIDYLGEHGGPAIAAGLAFEALRLAQPAEYFAWQPSLQPALEWRVINVDDRSVSFVRDAFGRSVSVDVMSGVLTRAAYFIDDEHWCAQLASTMGFSRLELRKSGNPLFPAELVISDQVDLLRDSRVPALVQQALSYTKNPLRLRSGPQLLALSPGKPIAAMIGRDDFDSELPMTVDALDSLASQNRSLDNLFGEDFEGAA